MSLPNVAAEPNTSARHSLARTSLLVYGLLIIYASCYPFSGWHDVGMSPLAYLTVHLPRYWTIFDVSTNIAGYIPFGLLLVMALTRKIPSWLALCIAVLVGVLVSGTMEALQTYLPSRVPSSLDFATNIIGTTIGACCGVVLTKFFAFHERAHTLRQRWFSYQATAGLVLIALWPLAQIYPQAYLFGHGQLSPILSNYLSQLLSTPIDLASILRNGTMLTVEQYWLTETLITACNLTGASLSLLCLLRKAAPKGLLLAFFITTAIAVKTLACALLFAPANALTWITPGAQGGLLIGIILLYGLAFAPAVIQRRLAIVTLLLSLAMINVVPANPYFIETLQGWAQGKFLNFNGAAKFLSLSWPFFAICFLCHPWHKKSNSPH